MDYAREKRIKNCTKIKKAQVLQQNVGPAAEVEAVKASARLLEPVP